MGYGLALSLEGEDVREASVQVHEAVLLQAGEVMEDFDTLKAQKDAIERRQFQDQAWVALRDIEDYALGKITLSRLGEILGQSPPVLRRIIVRAGKLMSGEES